MITIKEISHQDGVLTCQIDNMPSEIIVKKQVIVHNGINVFSSQAIVNRVLNALIHIDDLELSNNNYKYICQKKDYTNLLTEQEIEEFKVEPFDHQLTAVNFLLQNPNSLVLDGMGLG